MKLIINTRINHKIFAANKNVYVAPVYHPNRKMGEHDLIYVMDGEWDIGIDNKIYNVKKDNVLFLPANVYHFGVGKCEKNTATMFIHASCENGDGYSNSQKTGCFENFVNLNVFNDVSKNRDVKELFTKIIDAKNNEKELIASAYFSMLLNELSENEHNGNKDNLIALKIKKIIDSDVSGNISNSEIAEKFNLSVKSIEIKFKKYFGFSIHKYILNKKMEQAKHFLEYYPKMKIIDISLNLGFYDEYHFSRQFKKYVGLSPSAYRQDKLVTESITCI